MKRTACVYALAAGTGLALGTAPALAEPAPATVASGLQVNIVPPGTVTNDSTIPLDVKFRGGNIRIVELSIDGTRITRQALTTRDGHGTLHFTLDPTLLSEGSHEILIKAYEADGTCATSTTHLVVTSGALNALARFVSPKRNAEVQGVVPILVKISDTVRNPYVTFLIDKDFLALRNYAPYNYNWDSAKVGNGLHTLTVQVIDGDTSEVVQTITVDVNVKNIDGFTSVNPAVPDKGTPKAETPDPVTEIAKSVLPDANLGTRDLKSLRSGFVPKQNLRIGRPLPGVFTGFHPGSAAPVVPGIHPGKTMMTPGGARIAPENPGSVLPMVPTPIKAQPRKNSVSAIGSSAVNSGAPHRTAPGIAGLAANPSDLVTPLTDQRLAYQPLRVHRQGGIALRPPTAIAFGRTAGTPAAPRITKPLKPRSLNVPLNSPLKTFDVAFNHSMINFDVPPRIENGIPLAPFRAIFEHSGGTVQWFDESKVVRASDGEHEIEIHVGSRDAKVNNQTLTMEAIPYIDRGRTIVPLSFIRDSMDVKVTFDPETGHLLIESTK